MQKIYIDTVNRSFFNSDGDSFPNGYPKLAYKRQEKIIFQLCKESPDYGSPGVDPETWKKDTSFDLPGITALLSLDDDFRRRRSGILSAEATADSSVLNVVLDNTKRYNIDNSGILRVWKDDGTPEAIKYDSFTVQKNDRGEDTSTFYFKLSPDNSISQTYPAKTSVDIPDSLYAQAAMIEAESDPSTGLFVFDLSAYSAKLRAKMEYTNTSNLDSLAGMELLLFTVNENSVDIQDNFLCTTVSLSATMAEANPTPDIPDTETDALVAIVSAAVSRNTRNPLQLQFSADGMSWHDIQTADDRYYRQRIANINAEWSDAIAMQPGVKGADGTDGYTPQKGIDYWTDADKQEIKNYVDNAILNGEW